VRAQADGLRIGITGNAHTDGTAIIVLIQANSGGQNILQHLVPGFPARWPCAADGHHARHGLRPRPAVLHQLASGSIYTDQVNLTTSGATKTYLGHGTLNNGSGALTGGTNTYGVAVAMDNTNSGGVTASSVANAANATKGLEALFPYAALNLPATEQLRAGRTVKIAAAIVNTSGQFGNQWLPGCPAGAASLGAAPNMNNAGRPAGLRTDAPDTSPALRLGRLQR